MSMVLQHSYKKLFSHETFPGWVMLSTDDCLCVSFMMSDKASFTHHKQVTNTTCSIGLVSDNMMISSRVVILCVWYVVPASLGAVLPVPVRPFGAAGLQAGGRPRGLGEGVLRVLHLPQTAVGAVRQGEQAAQPTVLLDEEAGREAVHRSVSNYITLIISTVWMKFPYISFIRQDRTFFTHLEGTGMLAHYVSLKVIV